jgi:hypothetical protein
VSILFYFSFQFSGRYRGILEVVSFLFSFGGIVVLCKL